MIRSRDEDTAEPRRLYHWKWSKGTTELPLSRPESEATLIAYMITKRRILLVLAEIGELVSSLQPFSYDTILQLDACLSEVRSQAPAQFFTSGKYDQSALADTPRDQIPSLETQRMSLAFLYHQGMCILHRRYLAHSRTELRFALSRSRCIGSATALLA